MGSDWEATEERLVAHSDERRSELARRDRRRSVMPWLLAPLVFPLAGAAAVVALVESEGGDFAGWSTAQAAAALRRVVRRAGGGERLVRPAPRLG